MLAAELVAHIRDKVAREPGRMHVLWIVVTEDRDAFAREVREQANGLACVPLVLRKQSFSNPNAIGRDLQDLIAENRVAFSQGTLLDDTRREGCLVIVVVARAEFCVAQAASPVELPSWVPVFGGRVEELFVEDVTWSATAPLSDASVGIPEMCEVLFELEGALLERLKASHEAEHRRTNALLDVLRRTSDSTLSFGEFLQQARETRSLVVVPSAFRPSTKDGRSLVARLWSAFSASPPEKLNSIARGLLDALGHAPASRGDAAESLAAVLLRPSGVDDSLGLRWSRNLIVTIGVACQLITAAAHADYYDPFPVSLSRSLSYDLRRVLRAAVTALSS